MRYLLVIVGYVLATFVVQGLSHFVVFAQHYATLPNLRPQPIFALGLASMIIQGGILAFVFERSAFVRQGLYGAVLCSWMSGAFLVSYIALAEAGKYVVPDIASWIGIEAGVGLVQFTAIGLLLGLVYRTSSIKIAA